MGDDTQHRAQFWLVAQLRGGLTRNQFERAVKDIRDGWGQRTLWGTMGLQDIRQRYRRSMIGPFWLTISMGVTVCALGLLYGQIFKRPLDEYLPYIAAGFIIWGFLSNLVLDGSKAFIAGEGVIRQLPAPVSIHVYRMIWSNLIILAHNIWILLFVALIFGMNPGWGAFLAIPGLVLLVVNGMWLGLLLGLFSARFRDIPQIIASIVQVMFFITPIIWKPEMLPGRALILELNPFYHLVEIVRAPLLGQVPSLENWIAVLVITILGWAVAMFFFVAYRWRIAYWI